MRKTDINQLSLIFAHMMEQQVKAYIEKEKLFAKEDKILVALSGGADSVALLRILHAAGFCCEAAHCNFHLRGEESDRDEQFVYQLCTQLDIPLHIAHFSTAQYAAEKHISIEMAARELRYEWFEESRKACGATVVAVAHHRDDSAETILLNLIRGTGLNGLSGIRPLNGFIARPLLCIGRTDILYYLQSIGQDYVTDSSNLTNEYTRNKIRLDLLPLMQEINPSILTTLAEMGNRLNDVTTIYNRYMEEVKQRIVDDQGIRIEELRKEPAPKAVLFDILHPLGFNAAQINEIFLSTDRQSGKQFTSQAWRVIKDRAYLLIEHITDESTTTSSPPFRLTKEEKEYTADFQIPQNRETACFDADKLTEEICLRKWQQGDSFVPFGMRGRKKVSDYMTDRKFSISRKEQQWVLCCGKEIIWLIGERTDNRFRLDGNTRRVIIYTIIPF